MYGSYINSTNSIHPLTKRKHCSPICSHTLQLLMESNTLESRRDRDTLTSGGFSVSVFTLKSEIPKSANLTQTTANKWCLVLCNIEDSAEVRSLIISVCS